MYSILRRIGDDMSIVQGGITTLEIARSVASRFRQKESNRQVRYYILSSSDQAGKTTKSSKNQSVPPKSTPIQHNSRRPGGAYRVIRVQGDWQQFVKGSFQTEDEACEYALELQKRAMDPSITYWVEYAENNHLNTRKPHIPKSQRTPNQESKSRRRYSRERAPDYRRDDWYRDDELLGLGIPAQTGHGRKSRKWFNDPT